VVQRILAAPAAAPAAPATGAATGAGGGGGGDGDDHREQASGVGTLQALADKLAARHAEAQALLHKMAAARQAAAGR